ncbi:hypothetical protein E2C01_017190 [Portunus trituberculatus]|uniref:Uncharacterized protein n=1 Tax=Portunus trituberculatus TaxID=210409 RepID=A0A5B7DRS4_PORTR|nr:hypothetical protein [Portunus trituberculatus]
MTLCPSSGSSVFPRLACKIPPFCCLAIPSPPWLQAGRPRQLRVISQIISGKAQSLPEVE